MKIIKSLKQNDNFRAVTFAVSLYIWSIFHSLLFIPLSRVINYHIFLLILFSTLGLITFTLAVGSNRLSKRIIWGSYSGITLWFLLGDVLSTKGAPWNSILRPVSDIRLYSVDTILFLAVIVILLIISRFYGSIEDGLSTVVTVFCVTWVMEIYFRNYSESFNNDTITVMGIIFAVFFCSIGVFSVLKLYKTNAFDEKVRWAVWLYFGFFYSLSSLIVLTGPMYQYF